jgi:hypothetical protein
VTSQNLRLATHPKTDAYWSGGEYELNLSFGTLRDRQWQRLIPTIWQHTAISGPFAQRFVPGESPQAAEIQVPEPDAAQVQYAGLQVESLQVGCGVLVTRSLFECITLQVPLGMFEGLEADPHNKFALRIEPLDFVYREIALTVFDVVPFDLANIGFQCECRLVAELRIDTKQRLELMMSGNFFAQDEVLSLLGIAPGDYPAVRPGLRWVPSGR